VTIFADLYVYVFQKVSRDKILHYYWNNTLRLD